MRSIHRSAVVFVFFLGLATHPIAQRLGPQKGAPPAKTAPAPTVPEQKAKPGASAEKPITMVGQHGTGSTTEENEAGESDPAFDLGARLKRDRNPTGATASEATSSSALRRLVQHPRRDDLARWLEDSLRGKEIDVALLGGHKYMINDCLGIKASSGKFRLKLENPSVRVENTGIVLRFAIDHVSFSVLKLRMRPNPNPLELCKFSKKFEVGGDMDDVRLTLYLDPLYDPERCRIGLLSDLNPEVRIGNLNLKPLQNDLDKMAKNMIEDALNLALQAAADGTVSTFGDHLFSSIDHFLEADCPTRPGDTGRATTRAAGVLGGAATSAGGKGSSAGTSAGAQPEVEALLARIAALEARIAELEAGAGSVGASAPAGDLAALLRQTIERLGTSERGALAGPELRELLARLLALTLERSGLGDARTAMDELTELVVAFRAHGAEPVNTTAAAATKASASPWYQVPNPELKGRMGRIVVRFPDAKLSGDTHVQVNRDGKKVADTYGEAAWEFLPGVIDMQVLYALVPGCEVKTGHDTVLRTGMLALELGAETHFTLFRKGEPKKLTDRYGSATLGLPIGEYEVEIQDQREPVTVREGEITRF